MNTGGGKKENTLLNLVHVPLAIPRTLFEDVETHLVSAYQPEQ